MFKTEQNNFSSDLKRLIFNAFQIAEKNKQYVTTLHLMLALLERSNNIQVHIALKKMLGNKKEEVKNKIKKSLDRVQTVDSEKIELSKDLKIRLSELVKSNSNNLIDSFDMLKMLLTDDVIISNILKECDISITESKINRSIDKEVINILNSYFINLNEKIEHEKPNIYERNKEIKQIINTLVRLENHSVLLIGPKLSGKSYIVKGLVQKIVNDSNDIPDVIKNKFVLSLNYVKIIEETNVLSNTQKTFENFSKLLFKLFEKLKTIKDDIIIFIDDIGMMLCPEFNQIVSKILRVLLVEMKFCCIATGTEVEYNLYIKNNEKLLKAFKIIELKNTNEEDTINIMKSICENYEKAYGILVSNNTLTQIYKLSQKYLVNQSMPSKAIDLLESIISEYHTNNIKDLRKLTKLELEQVVVKVLGLPSDEFVLSKIPSSKSLYNKLKNCIVGQDYVIASVSNILYKRLKLKQQLTDNRPIASFVFLGPTGVGKTELAKSISKVLFGSEDFVCRFDMSEYMEEHSVSKLIGSPPGYVGFELGGQLTNAVLKNPFSVVLLDEIEKAHPKILDLLLQILDAGVLTDNVGRTVNFSYTIIIMTSNIGSRLQTDPKHNGIPYVDLNEKAKKIFRSKIRPELYSRIDDVLLFTSLSAKDLFNVVKLKLKEYVDSTGSDISYISNMDIIDYVNKVYDPRKGARVIRLEDILLQNQN